VNLNGGNLLVAGLLSIGHTWGTTGSVTVLGGELTVTNTDTRVGDSGFGQLTVSNATAWLTNLTIGRDGESSGEVTVLNGGIIQVASDTDIGRFNGSTGVVSIAGGQVLGPGQKLKIGREGFGQMAVSGGNVQMDSLLVAADPTNSAAGVLTLTGGSVNLASSLIVGAVSFSAGQAAVNAGTLSITNAGTNGVLALANGTFSLNGGEITTDSLLITNASGHLIFNSGTITSRNTTVANGAPFVVGNGVTPAALFLNGGTHMFAGGLIISSNATLAGCGTVVGSITSYGTISTNCGGTIVPPTITTAPQNQTVAQGSNVTFTVLASGSGLAYQWRFGGSDLPGATSSTYTRANVQPADGGSYTVIITNLTGSVTSTATLTVVAPPSITVAPQSQTVAQGSNVTFTVVASGSGLAYQWRFGGSDLPGATSSAYTQANVQPADAGIYTVVITNIAGSVTSTPATLTVANGGLVPATIAHFDKAGTTTTVSLLSVSGQTYTLEFKNSLAQAAWTAISPSTNGNGGIVSLQDPTATVPIRFYHVHVK
jgi:T5SS/PEP-CTERM-associated repeat protein